MHSAIKTVLLFVLLAAALAGGYFWGSRQQPTTMTQTEQATRTTADASAQAGKRKVLYYRNPMGLPDTSPVPKKDPMGMDYIPVYEGEAEESSGKQLKISTEKIQKLGVRTEPAGYRQLTRTVRAVGTLQIDERRINTVAPKFEGWIERLYVNTTGQPVAKGQPLMEVYSPDLVTAQQEYLIAARGVEAVKEGGHDVQSSMRQLMAGALQRLRNWDISDRELQELQAKGTIRRTIAVRSPVSGVVVDKPAVAGKRFMPGEVLYQISDLSALWVLADIFEQDLALVHPGQTAKVAVNAFPGKTFNGKVAFFYPTITSETRTGKVRIELPNPGGLLKPSMYASVELATGGARKVIAVPTSAVIDSGVRRIVLVQVGEGRFEPREVKTGTQAEDYVEITDGVKEGEAVVVAANFLLDAESNLKAAIGGFGAQASGSGAQGQPTGVGHRGEGTVDSVDAKAGTMNITHGAIPSLRWPPMAMEFKLANPALAANIARGASVAFEIVEREPGVWVITKLERKGAPQAAAPHAGH